MPNMSYCRFQNTAPDLKDCLDEMDSLDAPDEYSGENDKAEWRSRRRLIKYCVEIAECYRHELDD